MQDDHRAHLEIEPQERALELVTIDDGRLDVVACRRVDRRELHREPVTTEPSCLVDACANQEPVEPGVESIGVAECRKIAPRAHERVLDRVLRLFRIAKDQPGSSIESGADRGRDGREGVMIASLRPLHEVSLHAVPRCGAAVQPRSTSMARAIPRFVPDSPIEQRETARETDREDQLQARTRPSHEPREL